MIFAPLAERTLQATLENAVKRRPDHPALRDESGMLTYAQLWEAGRRFAGGYRSLGVERDDRVLLMLDNHIDAVLSWVGLSFAAGVETLVNTAYRGAVLERVVQDSAARVAVVEVHYLAQFLEAAGDSVETVVVRGSSAPAETATGQIGSGPALVPFDLLSTGTPAEPERVEPWDLMAVLYTSGTTGVSKGVLLTHAAAHATSETVGNTNEDDVRFVVLPLFHAAGQWGGIYRSFIAGATAYIAPRFHASTFWQDARRVGATTTQLIGAIAEFMMLQPASPEDAENLIREVHMVPVLKEVEKFRQRFNVDVVTAYGSTESGNPIFDLEPHGVRRGRVGKPSPLMEVRIVDEHDLKVPDGQVGEAIVRSREPWLLMLGYQGHPEASLRAWRNGWLHTSDAFYRDPDGFFHYVDRLSDALRRRGENISSIEVEKEVNSHSDIVESAAVAVQSQYTEDEIKVVAVRIAGSSLTEAQLTDYLVSRLPNFMVPRYIEFRTELPRTPTAKIRKYELRAAGVGNAWDREAHQVAASGQPGRS